MAWELLRDRRCLGLKFRRQQPIRGYIVDFYCAELRLALEIEGGVHFATDERCDHDMARVERLNELGIVVVHIRPTDVPRLPEILTWVITTISSPR